jgi:hypothetical protein
VQRLSQDRTRRYALSTWGLIMPARSEGADGLRFVGTLVSLLAIPLQCLPRNTNANHLDRMVDCGGPVVLLGIFLTLDPTSPNSRRGDHGCLNHRYQFALRVAVTTDVALGRLDRPMTGQQLDIAQRAVSFVHQPGCTCDERPAS